MSNNKPKFKFVSDDETLSYAYTQSGAPVAVIERPPADLIEQFPNVIAVRFIRGAVYEGE